MARTPSFSLACLPRLRRINQAHTVRLLFGTRCEIADLGVNLVIPWGRFGSLRKDLEAAGKSKSEGGSGIAKDFWEWSEKQVKPFL